MARLGRRVVHAEQLGGLILLAAAVGPGPEPDPDVRALEHAATAAPWMLATLDVVAETVSLRAAAALLGIWERSRSMPDGAVNAYLKVITDNT